MSTASGVSFIQSDGPMCGMIPSKPLGNRLTVFCDLDGPLVDVSKRYYKTYQLAIAETQAHYQNSERQPLNLTPLSASQFWQMKQERIPDVDIAFCSGFRHEQIDCFLAHVQDIVNQPILLQEDQIQPQVGASLLRLLEHGATISVVTLRHQAQAIQVLQENGLAPFFTEIRGTQDRLAAYRNYTEQKQELLVDLVQQAQQQSDRPCWMVGDTEADILAGKALGLPTLALTCGMRSQAFLQQLEPTAILPDLAQATQYLINQVLAKGH